MAPTGVRNSTCLELGIGLDFYVNDGGLERNCDKQSLNLTALEIQAKKNWRGDWN
jgi:hypothetical protein